VLSAAFEKEKGALVSAYLAGRILSANHDATNSMQPTPGSIKEYCLRQI
jgi:hypothetical protein